MRRGQVATEFIILFALVLLIFIPLFYFLSQTALGSQDQLIASKMDRIGNTLVHEAREIYYLGRFSREVISVEFPRDIEMSIVHSDQGEHYLLITYILEGQRTTTYFPSEVPIRFSNAQCQAFDECAPTVTCTECTIDADDVRSGRRNFQLETILDDDSLIVEIRRVT